MIASPALSPLAALPIPGSMMPSEPAEALQGADFRAILAISAQQAVPAGEVPIDPSALTALTLPQPTPANAAASMAATTGKILPPALPHAVMPEAALAAETPPEADAPPAAPAPTALLHRAALPRGLAKKAEPAAPIAEEPALATAEDADLPEAAPPSVPVIAQLTLPAPALAALTAHAPPQPGHSAHAAVLRALPVLTKPSPDTSAEPVAALQTALAVLAPRVQRPTAPAAPLIETAAPVIETAAPPAAAPAEAPPVAAPLRQMRVEVMPTESLQRPARADAVRLIRLPAALAGDESEAAAPALLPLTAPPAPPQSLLASAPAAAPTRPQDFAALIDRLSAAREAAAPHSVTVSLPHADFGRVQLHFRHEDGALAVSLASADPDFARIAAQAAPPVIALPEPRSADAATGNQPSGARSEGQSAQSTAGGQQRGHGHDRRSDGQHQSTSQPRTRASAERHVGRSGIFA